MIFREVKSKKLIVREFYIDFYDIIVPIPRPRFDGQTRLWAGQRTVFVLRAPEA